MSLQSGADFPEGDGINVNAFFNVEEGAMGWKVVVAVGELWEDLVVNVIGGGAGR